MGMNWSGTRGTGAGKSNYDDDDDCRDGGAGGEESPGLGAVGDDAVSRPARGSDAALSNRHGVGGRSVMYIIWYQVAEGDLYSRVEVTRLDDAQAIWDMLVARGRLMRSARP